MKDKNIEDIYELSPMQQGMLFHSLYDPNSRLYFEQLVCTLEGDLNVSLFKQAWQQVVARHPILRSTFYWEELDEPLQVVKKQVVLPWVQHDWRFWPPTEQQQSVDAFLEADQAQGFDLEQAPLMRFALLQLAKKTHELVWSHHHLLFDGWSMPIILDEVLALYHADQSGETLPLKSPRPYRDYIRWLQQQDRIKAKDFWQQTLQGFAAPTPVNVGKSYADSEYLTQPASYAEAPIQLSSAITEQLQTLARQQHVTLNNVVQGAWALLLSRYSGEPDVVFGATVSGRPTELLGVDSMVGLFINTLPVRIAVSGDTELLAWLKALQAQYVAQEQYAYLSLADIQQLSAIPKGTALFESILVFESYPFETTEPKQKRSLAISQLQSFERTNYPLTVVINPKSSLSGRIIYDMGRFEAATIRRMIGHFQTLLAGIAAKPEQRLADLSMLTAAERHQVLVEWNDTTTDYPADQCIHQLFEAQVARTPEAVAVVFEAQQLTYQQLNNRANQLAHYLHLLGVKPEVLIGMCMERSIDMIVGLLGILKAGGAYVPIDPNYPSARIQFMLEDSAAPILLTQTALQEQLPVAQLQLQCQVLYLDEADFNGQPINNLALPNRTDHLAYVMYTSGSTGTPKGVCVVHRAVVRLVKNTHYVQLGAYEVFLQLAPISFDAATFEIWGSLLNGSKLILFPNTSPDLAQLGQVIRHHNITTLWLTAGLFHTMLDERPDDLRPLRQLLAGGDVLSVSHVQRCLEVLPQTQLINGYGPTENTTFTCCYPITKESDLTRSVPIGGPIANTQVYLLDSDLQPVPIGVPGELYIGGDGLARGYLNQPELTETSFIPNPFSEQQAARLYKTGDLARWLPDGTIEFMGRRDHQVKIRGFRIELGEIECVIKQHPEVQEAVAIVREDSPGDKTLVAYIIPQHQPLTASTLRDFLKSKLPDYMVPSAFVLLEMLPLTPNGKIDRRALPAPDSTQRYNEVDFVAPRNETEKALAAIWLEVLGLKQVSIHDNFFEVGGHSLRATQVVSRIQETFSVQWALRTVFEHPTIAELAELVVAQQLENAESDTLAQILGEVDALSDDEVAQMLSTTD